jgi:hypothetical protein
MSNGELLEHHDLGSTVFSCYELDNCSKALGYC